MRRTVTSQHVIAHTPGPWMFGETSHEILGVACGVVPVASPCDDYDEEQWLIDGKLIAAAPDMLDALNRVESYLGELCDHGVLDGHPAFAQWTAVLAAIAKAEGRS